MRSGAVIPTGTGSVTRNIMVTIRIPKARTDSVLSPPSGGRIITVMRIAAERIMPVNLFTLFFMLIPPNIVICVFNSHTNVYCNKILVQLSYIVNILTSVFPYILESLNIIN